MQTKTRLGLEELSRRDMPSVATVTFADGIITLDGTPDRDVASAVYVGGYVRARVLAYEPGSTVGVGQTMDVPIWMVDTIIFRGYEGNDEFTNNTAKPSAAMGGAGVDVLRGGSNWDWFDGGSEGDTLDGNGGNDLLQGGTGRDWLFGDSGDDGLYGEGDGDWLYGGGGKDILNGGAGSDYLNGGIDGDADKMTGGAGIDYFVVEEYSLGFGPVNRDEPQDEEPADVVMW